MPVPAAHEVWLSSGCVSATIAIRISTRWSVPAEYCMQMRGTQVRAMVLGDMEPAWEVLLQKSSLEDSLDADSFREARAVEGVLTAEEGLG